MLLTFTSYNIGIHCLINSFESSYFTTPDSMIVSENSLPVLNDVTVNDAGGVGIENGGFGYGVIDGSGFAGGGVGVGYAGTGINGVKYTGTDQVLDLKTPNLLKSVNSRTSGKINGIETTAVLNMLSGNEPRGKYSDIYKSNNIYEGNNNIYNKMLPNLDAALFVQDEGLSDEQQNAFNGGFGAIKNILPPLGEGFIEEQNLIANKNVDKMRLKEKLKFDSIEKFITFGENEMIYAFLDLHRISNSQELLIKRSAHLFEAPVAVGQSLWWKFYVPITIKQKEQGKFVIKTCTSNCGEGSPSKGVEILARFVDVGSQASIDMQYKVEKENGIKTAYFIIFERSFVQNAWPENLEPLSIV